MRTIEFQSPTFRNVPPSLPANGSANFLAPPKPVNVYIATFRIEGPTVSKLESVVAVDVDANDAIAHTSVLMSSRFAGMTTVDCESIQLVGSLACDPRSVPLSLGYQYMVDLQEA